MQAPTMDDELWTLIEPLLPQPRRRKTGCRGRPLRKPKAIYADCGYDSESHLDRMRIRGTKPIIAKLTLNVAAVWARDNYS